MSRTATTVSSVSSAEFTVLVLTMMLQPPGVAGGVPGGDLREAERLADEVLNQGDKIPFDVRAQALAIKGFYTRALNVYVVGLRERGLVPPGYGNTLLDLINNHPALRRPETLMIPDPVEDHIPATGEGVGASAGASADFLVLAGAALAFKAAGVAERLEDG